MLYFLSLLYSVGRLMSRALATRDMLPLYFFMADLMAFSSIISSVSSSADWITTASWMSAPFSYIPLSVHVNVRSFASMVSPSDRMTAFSMQFCSSRMLPFHGQDSSMSIASLLMEETLRL